MDEQDEEDSNKENDPLPHQDHGYARSRAGGGARKCQKKKQKGKTFTITEKLSSLLVTSTDNFDGDVQEMMARLGQMPENLKGRKHGSVSVLMRKGPVEMKEFDVNKIVEEMIKYFPELTALMLRIMVPRDRITEQALAETVPRLATIYGILLFSRNTELSLLQRTVTMCLYDHLVDQKVCILDYVAMFNN